MTLQIDRLPVERSEFSTDDPATAEALSTEMYGTFQPKYGSTKDFAFDGRRTSAGDISLDHLLHSNMSIDCGPRDYLMFVFITRGSLSVTSREMEGRLRVGDTAVFPAEIPLTISWDRMSKETMTMPLQAAEKAALEMGGNGDLRFLGVTPVSSAMDRFWRSTVGFVANQLETPDSPLAEPLVHAQTLNLLGAAAVKTFPNTTMTADYEPGPGQVSAPALRRAVAYMDANADRPISVTDVAAAIAVSPSALRQAFVQHYGTSPLGYLHRVRLERARRDLRAADPNTGATVTSIATRWGFARPDAFSSAYHGAYGQAPGHTLRN